MDLKKLKEYWDKFWFIVWKDDSFKGWLISLAFIFVVVKFVFFPSLSFVTGTIIPLAIVESCSMYHDGNLLSDFDSWWQLNQEKYSEFGIEKNEFESFSFKNGFNKGDILFITGANTKNLEIGDVIIFYAGLNYPVIHRIVKIEETSGVRFFSTLGDHNLGQLGSEKSISEDKIIGKAQLKALPYVGWIKQIFFEAKKPSSERGFCE